MSLKGAIHVGFSVDCNVANASPVGGLVFPKVGDPFLASLIALFTRANNDCLCDVCVWGDFEGVKQCGGKLM